MTPILKISFVQALAELKSNKLRSLLSLTGITIGIFCIIAVFTVLDSLKKNIQEEVSSLGSDVLYINRWPWMDEGGEYKWWEFWHRPSMDMNALTYVQQHVPEAAASSLLLKLEGKTVKFQNKEASGSSIYAVSQDYEKMQNIEIAIGRYFNRAEIDGGHTKVVLGEELCKNLLGNGLNPLDKNLHLLGKHFKIIGVLKKTGKNAAGMDYDNALIIPYYAASAVVDVHSLNYDPILMVKAAKGISTAQLKDEMSGALRRIRKVKPGEKDDFAINELSQVSERMDQMFGLINTIGGIIGGISLVVGAFGIANIMFVSVKERTRLIGVKKALGAKSNFILIEFLIEAVMLCLIGGILGIFLVFLLTTAISHWSDFSFTLSIQNIIIGLFSAAFVGVLAGYIPAKKASKLNPVAAIRSL